MSILMYKQRHRHPNYRKTPKCNYAHIGYIATRPGGQYIDNDLVIAKADGTPERRDRVSNNLASVTAQYIDVRLDRKKIVLGTYHQAIYSVEKL